jgi:hypothetical protein
MEDISPQARFGFCHASFKYMVNTLEDESVVALTKEEITALEEAAQ